MNTMPVKFRSPPPKPPRRRHSDQLSPSSAFSCTRKKYFTGSQSSSSSDNQQEHSISSCGSLPSNWTPDFCLEEKIPHQPVFEFKTEEYSRNNTKNFCNKFAFGENMVDIHRNSLENIKSIESKNYLNYTKTKYKLPYIPHNEKTELSSPDSSKDILGQIKFDKTSDIHSFFHKDHKRHYSDPLPFRLKTSILPSNSEKVFNSEYLEEHRKNHSLLLEIKSLKEMNNNLWEHLCSVQKSLDKLKKNSIENSNSLSASDILSSIYVSLKAKENAMEDRMKIILQERDNVLHDLDNLLNVLAKSFEDNYFTEEKSSDCELKELLKEIEATNSPIKLLQQQRLLLSHLYRSKELKQDYLVHEIKVASSERDNLRAKVKMLEDELSNLKMSNEIRNVDNKFWESSLLNVLYQVIQQRDVAIKNYGICNMDFFTSRGSNHEKSFDSDVISDCLQKLEEENVKKVFQSPQNDSKIFSTLNLRSKTDDGRYLKEEILILNKSLEFEIEKREIAEEKCIKLERLVNVLQKKINGQNVGIPV